MEHNEKLGANDFLPRSPQYTLLAISGIVLLILAVEIQSSWEKFRYKSRPIAAGFVVKLGTVKLEADGWYLSLALEDKTVPIKEDEEICPTTENSIAIDVGLERFLTCDNGTYIEIPRFLRKASDRLARLQRAKSKLPKGHKDKPKLYEAIAKLHQKIARQRQNFHFVTAYWLFSKADVVFIENLKLKNFFSKP